MHSGVTMKNRSSKNQEKDFKPFVIMGKGVIQ